MKPKFTQGPWKVMLDKTKQFWAIYHQKPNDIFFKVICPVKFEDKQDANLIAAAPELYEALKYALEYLEHNRCEAEYESDGHINDSKPDCAKCKALSAISTAEGRE